MRIINTDKDFQRCQVSLNDTIIWRGNILEADEERGKVWVIDYNHPLGYQVVRGTVKIHLMDVVDATRLIRS